MRQSDDFGKGSKMGPQKLNINNIDKLNRFLDDHHTKNERLSENMHIRRFSNTDKTFQFENKLRSKFITKCSSESCLYTLRTSQTNANWFDKTVEIVEHKIRMYMNCIKIKSSKKRATPTSYTSILNSSFNNSEDTTNWRNKPKKLVTIKNLKMDTTENNNNCLNTMYQINKKSTLTRTKKSSIVTEQSHWCFLCNSYPKCSKRFIKSLQQFSILTNQCYNHSSTDPTERFFIQQLNLVTANALRLTKNDDTRADTQTICLETLDNFVTEIRQIFINQSKMNIKYVMLNRLLIKILRIFEYGIHILESVEISLLAYDRAFEKMDFFNKSNKLDLPLLFKCFNKVPSIHTLLVSLRREYKKNVNRSNSSTVSKPRLSSLVTRKASVPAITDSLNSIYLESRSTIDRGNMSLNNAYCKCVDDDDDDDDDADLPAITHSLDNFTIIKLISQGASATVYLVNCNRTLEHYALKMIGKRSTLIKNQVKNVFLERDVLSVTKSPFIVELYCSFETSTHVCLLTEYVRGGDCASILRKRKPFSIELIRHVTAQLVLAIEYIHKMGIVHRDIKPANVLLSHDGTAKLTDFGLSTVTLPKYSSGWHKECDLAKVDDEYLVGTPDYFAPEIIQKVPYGKSVDWWCLGLFLYETSFTEPPFYGETIEELFNEILYGSIPWPTDVFSIEAETKDLIIHLLEKKPGVRWGDDNIDTIKNHALFENNVDWNNIHEKKINVLRLSYASDTRNYDCRNEFYDHEADFMSDLSVEDFSKVSESDVFHNYQYSSPSFSHKIRLSTSLNPFSDESRDSSSMKNFLESSLDSEKSINNNHHINNNNHINKNHQNNKSVVSSVRFNPSHRSSLLGTFEEHHKSFSPQPPGIRDYLSGAKVNSSIKKSRSVSTVIRDKFPSPKVVSPRVAYPKVVSPRVVSPKVAYPKVVSPKVASPKVASPKVASPKVAYPKVASPKVAYPKVAYPKVASPISPHSSPASTMINKGNNKNIVVSLKKKDSSGVWPGFSVGCRMCSYDHSPYYYIKEITNPKIIHPTFQTNMIISHIDGKCTATMNLKKVLSLIDDAENELNLTLIPLTNSQNFYLSQSLVCDIDTDVPLKSIHSSSSSSKNKYSSPTSDNNSHLFATPMEIDMNNSSSLMNSTFSNEYDFYFQRYQRKNSNLEDDVVRPIYLINASYNEESPNPKTHSKHFSDPSSAVFEKSFDEEIIKNKSNTLNKSESSDNASTTSE